MELTGAIFKTLSVDGESLRAFGVYITGEAVFNSPERSVEMITIPGRNGAFARDNGYFENIIVSYPAGIYADNEEDFAEAVSNLRNFLCSRRGYVRLEDDYNPDEYRLAVYKSGLEVSPALLRAGEFVITFECKPQRFLKSGEELLSITSGDKITNPTYFDARPLLEVYGYGAITINGEQIAVNNVYLGEVVVLDNGNAASSGTVALDTSLYNTGDALTSKGAQARVYFTGSPNTKNNTFFDVVLTDTGGTGLVLSDTRAAGNLFGVVADLPDMTFTAGTAATKTHAFTVSVTYTNSETGQTLTGSASVTVTYRYTGATNSVTMSVSTSNISNLAYNTNMRYLRTVYADSTKNGNGNPTYIDLDIGEAWTEDAGTPVSANNAVELPAELPALTSGDNVIAFGGAISKLEIVPRWWKV